VRQSNLAKLEACPRVLITTQENSPGTWRFLCGFSAHIFAVVLLRGKIRALHFVAYPPWVVKEESRISQKSVAGSFDRYVSFVLSGKLNSTPSHLPTSSAKRRTTGTLRNLFWFSSVVFLMVTFGVIFQRLQVSYDFSRHSQFGRKALFQNSGKGMGFAYGCQAGEQ
jgi:hypothetical protein